MIYWVKAIIEICLLKRAPQDIPTSHLALYVTVTTYFLTGIAITLHTQELTPSVVTALIETGLIIFMTNLILWVRKTPERFTQAITALMGTGTVIGLVAIPVLGVVTTAGNEDSIVSLFWILLIIWQTVVIGHVLRHTMEIPFIAGVGVALIYMYMSFAITLRILKVMAIPIAN